MSKHTSWETRLKGSAVSELQLLTCQDQPQIGPERLRRP